jgi:hypothetical protein
MKPFRIAVVAVFAAVVTLGAAGAEDTLTSARDLYSAASYEDALNILNRIRSTDQNGDEIRVIDQYRAFCLLALGRNADAEAAIESVLASDPFFQPASDVSPRVRSTFTDVRRRILPNIIQQRYATARAAFEKKDFTAAQLGFEQVLTVLSDPDVGAAAGRSPLADIRTLATDFRDLSAKAALPAPLPAAPIAETVPPPKPMVPRVFGPDDNGVVPPSVVRQALPPFEYQLLVPPPAGSVEVVIDERGAVESAMMRKSILAKYDALVIEATKSWQYKPATLNGDPVKYRKIVNITVKR